jgi:hypothetical protein
MRQKGNCSIAEVLARSAVLNKAVLSRLPLHLIVKAKNEAQLPSHLQMLLKQGKCILPLSLFMCRSENVFVKEYRIVLFHCFMDPINQCLH